MKYLTTTAVAALLAGSIAAFSLVPAQADDATPATAPAVAAPVAPPAADNVAKADEPNLPGMRGHSRAGGWNRGQDMRPNILNIACGDRGAEMLEIGFVHVQYAVKPTAAQQPLFDALKTGALADQKTFADACRSAMDEKTGDAAQKPSILDRLQTRVSIENAKVAALNDVLPKFKAFYDSLTDDQKAKLDRHNGPRVGFNQMWDHPGWGHFGPGHMGPHGPKAPDAQQGPDGQTNPADATDDWAT